jgi:hypothetical protein
VSRETQTLGLQLSACLALQGNPATVDLRQALLEALQLGHGCRIVQGVRHGALGQVPPRAGARQPHRALRLPVRRDRLQGWRRGLGRPATHHHGFVQDLK